MMIMCDAFPTNCQTETIIVGDMLLNLALLPDFRDGFEPPNDTRT